MIKAPFMVNETPLLLVSLSPAVGYVRTFHANERPFSFKKAIGVVRSNSLELCQLAGEWSHTCVPLAPSVPQPLGKIRNPCTTTFADETFAIEKPVAPDWPAGGTKISPQAHTIHRGSSLHRRSRPRKKGI